MSRVVSFPPPPVTPVQRASGLLMASLQLTEVIRLCQAAGAHDVLDELLRVKQRILTHPGVRIGEEVR